MKPSYIKYNAILYCTYHNCSVLVIDTDEDIANSPHNSVLCLFEDGRTQSIPIAYLTIVTESNTDAHLKDHITK
jgi:hypothetical protein